MGIIANPLSGSDIRRLVALGSVYGTQEKINVVQRVLAGLRAVGIEGVYLMPGFFGIARRAIDRLPQRLADLSSRCRVLDLPVDNSAADSTQAAREMRRLGAGCIIVLGGDGTSRAVAEGCGDVPILPISTGTNNVVPYHVEGTVAGMAAGFVARHPGMLDLVAFRSKHLDVCVDGAPPTSALVDVAVVAGDAVGSRAVWDADSLREVVLTRGEPGAVGLSSLAGFSDPIGPADPWGVHIILGEPHVGRVTVPLAPGLIASLSIQKVTKVHLDEAVIVRGGRLLLALDGEREVILRPGQAACVRLRADGPWVVDAVRALRHATAEGFFVQPGVDTLGLPREDQA